MNASSASENGPYSTNPRPFFYAQATAPQQSFPNPWLLGPIYNPYGIPAAGLRSGNPYFPLYPVPLHEYPGYLVPQHPMHMRVHRRPYFNGHPSSPMFYQATRFRHYSPGKRTETKETQTDVRQLESKPKKHQDHGIEMKGCEGANMVCVSSGGNKGVESSLEVHERTGSSPVSDRDFTKSPAGSVQFRGLPPPGYAFEKEEVRIEYANGGAPAIQLWKSFKETIPLYDVAKKDNIVQRDVFALSSCEEVVYASPEQGQLVPSISYPEEEKPLEDAQEKESQCKVKKIDSEKQGIISYRGSSPVDEASATQLPEPAKLDQTKQDPVMSKRSYGLKRSSGSRAPRDVSNLVRQRELFPSGMEIINDSYFPQKMKENSDVTNETWAASEASVWCDESEKYIPSESWLACLDNMDTNLNYDMYLSRRKRPSVLSVTSDEMSSVDEEGSSIDNVPTSYLDPDYILKKDICTFKKSTEGLGRERFRSGGSLNEDEEVVGIEQANLKRGSRIKANELSCRSRKPGVLPRFSSSRHLLYPHKKKASRSLSPSEVDDSEDYWVKEPEGEGEEEEEEEENEEREYLVPEAALHGTVNPSKGGFPYWKTGQQAFWKLPKNAVPTHIISWPVQEKMKMPGLAAKLKKEQEQVEDLCDDYNFFLKRPMAHQLEMFEHRRNSQKGPGRLQEEDRRIALDEYWVKSGGPDEYWTKSGAKPKFPSFMPGGLSPPTKSQEKDIFAVPSDNLYVDPPKKKKGMGKPPHKRRDTRCDTEVKEREKPKTAHHKGREAKRSLYKRR
uniref:Trinucleotide repeat-containing gene 18 protein n=1 Tax=Pogona vitticeps TaxID=103695 RepID=A0A6J0V8J6_9SAUR